MSFNSDPALLVNQLPISIEFPKDDEKFLETITLMYKRMAQSINNKEGGLYSLQELYNSQLYFTLGNPQSFRNVYRKVFDVVEENGGPIAPGATVSFAHNITGIFAPTHIYGAATNSDVPAKYLPLPYVSATNITQQIQIYLTSTDVVLINGAAQTDLTQAYIVAEYVKN